MRAPTLPDMIASARAVAVVKVDSVIDLNVPPGYRTIWVPDHEVVVKVQHTLRGKLPAEFRARVESNAWHNQSLRSGSAAMVFVGEFRDGKLPVPDGHQPLFEMSKGFVLIEDIVEVGDAGLGAIAFCAILRSVRDYLPGQLHERWAPGAALNAAAISPFVELLNSESETLRGWTISKVLAKVVMTRSVGNALIEALDDPCPEVSQGAAQHLMFTRYPPATARLATYAEKLSRENSDAAAAIKCYLRGRRIKDAIGGFRDDLYRPLKADLFRLIAPGTPQLRLEVLIEGDAPVQVTRAQPEPLSDDTVERLREYLRLVRIPRDDNRAHFEMLLWLEDERIQLEIDNKCR